jgi:hypothetical protein
MPAIGIGNPYVLAPGAITQEYEMSAIGREAWLAIEWHARGEPCSPTTSDRENVEISKEIEDDSLTIG